jgi:hypothetical protein
MVTIYFPQRVSSNFRGYEFLAKIAFDTISLINEEVILNFENTISFEGNLCSVLGSVIDGMIQRRNRVKFEALSGRIQSSMQRNKFYSAITGDEGSFHNHGTTIYYCKFHAEDENGIKNYVESELLNRKEMPQISEALKREIIIKVFEIYANALTHGQSEYVFSSGQLYPRRSIPIINFTFVDLGKTIKNNVIEFLGRPMKGLETIIWATSDNNSTKKENHSGGIGLKLIKEFILQNGGKVQIVSGDGFWEFSQRGAITDELSYSFPGTIVNLTFNVSDNKKYYLASEIRSTVNIF